MALIQFDHGVSLDADYDWAIIGCGAVGIMSALKLAEKGQKVLILESGLEGERAEYQALNEGSFNRDDIASSATWGRKRALGGTTIRWGGQALPFRRVDFNGLKDGLGEWLLTVQELDQDYLHAEKYLGVGARDYWSGLEEWGYELEVADGVQYHLSKWAPEPNMYKVHGQRLIQMADVLFGAHVLGPTVVSEGNSKRIKSLRVGSLKGFDMEISVKNVILANGGLESVRFMMLHGLSSSPKLGQGFMEHPCADIGVCHTNDSRVLQRYFGTRMKKGKKYSVRLSLSEQTEENEQLLAASASLMFEEQEHFPSILTRFRKILQGNIGEVWGLLRAFPELLIAVREYAHHGIAFRPNPKIRIAVMAEQVGSATSQLGLDFQKLDAFGQPVIRIDWKYDDRTLESVRRIGEAVKKTLESNSNFKVKVELADWLQSSALAKGAHQFTPVNHHMGGAIMGKEVEGGVVDDQLRVYGIENLRLFSASVFPSSSHSNPTLTALALAHRSLRLITPTPRPAVQP